MSSIPCTNSTFRIWERGTETGDKNPSLFRASYLARVREMKKQILHPDNIWLMRSLTWKTLPIMWTLVNSSRKLVSWRNLTKVWRDRRNTVWRGYLNDNYSWCTRKETNREGIMRTYFSIISPAYSVRPVKATRIQVKMETENNQNQKIKTVWTHMQLRVKSFLKRVEWAE